MTLFKKRREFDELLVRIGAFFSRFKLSPNQWTLLTIVFVLVTFYFLVKQRFLVSAIFLLVSTFLDLVDGSVARVTGKVTKLGAYLDTIADRYVEGIIVFGLLFCKLPTFILPFNYWLFLYFFGALMTTYVKAAAKEKELVRAEIKGGILERADRLLLLFVALLLANVDLIYLTYVVTVLAILTNVSALQRIWMAIKKK